MKKNKILLLFTAVVYLVSLALTGCNKQDKQITEVGEKVDLEIPGIMTYYNFLNQKTNGVFAIQNFTTKAAQNDSRVTEVVGYFLNKDSRTIQGKTVYIDGLAFNSDPARNFGYFKNIISKKSPYSGRKIKINLGSGIGARLNEGGFYIPEDIFIDPGAGGSGGGGSTPPAGSDNLNVGKIFSWNADVNNANGVVIILEYDPTNLFNTAFSQAYPQRLRKAITVTDNGSYVFTASDLLDLPVGARITVTAGRANFETVTDGSNQTYSVYAYTIAEGFYLLQ